VESNGGLQSNIVFTKGAVNCIGYCHFEFLNQVAAILGDSNESVSGINQIRLEDVAAAVSELGFRDIADNAMDMILDSNDEDKTGNRDDNTAVDSTTSTVKTNKRTNNRKKKKRKMIVTEEMIAEQERLLQASKNKITSLQQLASLH